MKVSSLSVALATLSLSTAAPPNSPHGPPQPHDPPSKLKYPGLGALAKRAGLLYFGTAIDNVVLNNTAYVAIAHNASEFSQATPANGLKWMYTEPQRGVFNYTLADQIIQPAIKNGQKRRCHTFIWHNQLPDWLTSQNWTKTELTDILENHIKHVARNYYNDCYAWDVVNEAFNDDGTMRETIWLDTLGKDYIATAFKFARKYTSPATRLYYNDYNIESVGNKTAAVSALLKDLIRQGVPVDGVGLQSHFTIGRSPSYDDVKAAMKVFTDLGVEVAVTELDVRLDLPDNSTKQAEQAAIYADTVRACVDTDDCVGVTVWDFWDPVSWVPSTFPGYGNADLFDADLVRKPAYYSVSDVLRGD